MIMTKSYHLNFSDKRNLNSTNKIIIQFFFVEKIDFQVTEKNCVCFF